MALPADLASSSSSDASHLAGVLISESLDVPAWVATSERRLSEFPDLSWNALLDFFVALEGRYDVTLDCEAVSYLQTFAELQSFLAQAFAEQMLVVPNDE